MLVTIHGVMTGKIVKFRIEDTHIRYVFSEHPGCPLTEPEFLALLNGHQYEVYFNPELRLQSVTTTAELSPDLEKWFKEKTAPSHDPGKWFEKKTDPNPSSFTCWEQAINYCLKDPGSMFFHRSLKLHYEHGKFCVFAGKKHEYIDPESILAYLENFPF